MDLTLRKADPDENEADQHATRVPLPHAVAAARTTPVPGPGAAACPPDPRALFLGQPVQQVKYKDAHD